MRGRLQKSWVRAWAAASLVVLGVSCRGCHDAGPSDMLELAPKDSVGVLSLNDLHNAAKALEAFLGHATHKAGSGAVRRMREAATKQFGFDPLNPEALTQVGLRPQAGAMVFAETDPTAPLLVLGVGDKDAFDRTLRALITRVDGANKFTESTHQGRRVVTAGRPFGDTVTPAVHWAYVGDWVLIARGDRFAELDHALARLNPKPPAGTATSQSLRDDPTFMAARSHLPPGLLFAYARGSDGGRITSSWTFGADGFSSDTAISVKDPNSTKVLGDTPVLPLAGTVASDAALVLLSRAATPQTYRILRTLPALAPFIKGMDPIQAATGLRLEEDIMPRLSGPITIGVQVGDTTQAVSKMRAFSPQAALDMVHVAVTAELADPKGMASLLAEAQKTLKSRGIAIRNRAFTVKGAQGAATKVTVYEPDLPDPKLGWTVFGNKYVYGAGTGSLEATLERLSGPDSDLAATLNRGVVAGLAAARGGLVVVRGSQLAAAIDRAKQGEGGQSLGLNSIMTAAADILRTLDDVALSLDVDQGGVRIRAREQLQ